MKTTASFLTFVFLVGSAITFQGKDHTEWKADNPLDENIQKTLPCPQEQDILPCICTYNSDTLELLLDCSAVKNETELEKVFLAPFPDTVFSELRIENNVGLTVLDDVFGDVTFKEVYIYNVPNLSLMTEDSFFGSRNTLEKMYILNTQLSRDTAPILTFGLYPNLYYFFFSGDFRFVSFPIFASDYLTYVDILRFNVVSLPVDAFRGTPSVSVIGAHLLALTDVIPGTFDGLPDLATVNLNYNSISHLEFGILSVTSLTRAFNFSYNVITTVDEGAFVVESGAGSNGGASVDFNNNLLTELHSAVWQDLLTVIKALDLRSNPLICGCDLVWLVLAPYLMAKVHPNSTCSDGTLLHDLDPTIFEDLC